MARGILSERITDSTATGGVSGTSASSSPPTTSTAAYGTFSRSARMRSPAETARQRRTSSRPAKNLGTSRPARPGVVGSIYIRQRGSWVDRSGSYSFRTGNSIDEFGAEVPHLDRQCDRSRGAVGESKSDLGRHHHRPAIGEIDVRAAVGTCADRIDCLIEARGGVDPTAPEPVEVHSRLVAHHAEEIAGARVLERPRLDVFAERGVEAVLAQHLVTEH